MNELPSWAKSMTKLELANAWMAAREECDKLVRQRDVLLAACEALVTADAHAKSGDYSDNTIVVEWDAAFELVYAAIAKGD